MEKTPFTEKIKHGFENNTFNSERSELDFQWRLESETAAKKNLLG